MRFSKDQYRLQDGRIVGVSQSEEAPEGATLWNGYDYVKQEWVFEGKKDERTIEELKAAIEKVECSETIGLMIR